MLRLVFLLNESWRREQGGPRPHPHIIVLALFPAHHARLTLQHRSPPGAHQDVRCPPFSSTSLARFRWSPPKASKARRCVKFTQATALRSLTKKAARFSRRAGLVSLSLPFTVCPCVRVPVGSLVCVVFFSASPNSTSNGEHCASKT